MTSTKITSKLLEDKLKIGWNTADFAARLDISEQDFLELLSKTFEGRAYEIYARRLKENDKRREKSVAREKKDAANKRKIFRQEMATLIRESLSEDEEQLIEQEEDQTTELDKLIAQAEEVKNDIIDLEKCHKKLVVEKHENENTCRKLMEEMIRLREELKEKTETVELAIMQFEETSENMKNTNADIKAGKELLKEIEEKIKKLQKYIVCVTEAKIEVTPDFTQPSDDAWKSIRNEWMDDQKYADVTMAELNTLAKVTAIKRELEQQNLTFEITFSSDRLKSLFES